jgi:co-chaperonin GroES (HSP10)
MDKIQPQGQRLIVLPIEKDNHKTQGGIELVDTELAYAKVVETSTELQDVYKEGDTVVFPKGVGIGISYRNKLHLWVKNDEIWGIEKS